MNTIRKMRPLQILLIILAFTLSNCMSDDYNLNDGINKDITLGGDSLSFPIGKTSPIFMSSILNSKNNKMLKKMADGTYSMQLTDSFQFKVTNVKPVTFSIDPFIIEPVIPVYSGTDIPPLSIKSAIINDYSFQFISLNNQPKSDKLISNNIKAFNNLVLTTSTFYYAIPNETSNIVINHFVSPDVLKIYSLSLKSPSQLVFKIDVKNLPSTVDSMFFSNYTIKLPAFLKFNDKEVNSSNELILNSGFKVINGYSKILTFEALDFNSEGGITLDNGNINLIRIISMQGAAYIKGKNLTTPTEIGAFEIQPSLLIGDMSVSLIEGEIKPVMVPITKTIELTLPSFFKQTGSVLDVQNPVLTLKVGNSMGFLADATLSLTPKRNGSPVSNGSILTQFYIPEAALLGQSTWSNYWISKSNEGVSSGYNSIVVTDFSNLLKIAPDEIEMIVTTTIRGDRQHIDLYSPKNQIDIKYTMNVPLDFGKDFKIQYIDTISDLKKSLEQIVKLSKQIEIVATIENQIPLDLNFELVALDNSKKVITGITVSNPEKIKSCNIDATAQKSIINLGIKETAEGSLSQLDALQIKISSNKSSTVSGIPLKADQSITLQLRVKIPKGITLTKTN